VTLLSLEGIAKDYKVGGWPARHVRAVADVSFAIEKGDTLGIVGESGCGKSTLARLVLGLERPSAGHLSFRGRTYSSSLRRLRRENRGAIQAVLQDPTSSLNPRLKVGVLIAEPLREAEPGLNAIEVRERTARAADLVGLPKDTLDRYPHQFSGGQLQRIAIARAIVSNPALLVLDEPISSLDVSIAAQIMNLLKDLQQKLGISYLFIAHQLATVAYMSTHIGVMYLGRMVEYGRARDVVARPGHPYTKALVSAALSTDLEVARSVKPLGGEIPSPMNAPSGCHFHTRCGIARANCSATVPEWAILSKQQRARCHYPLWSDIRSVDDIVRGLG